MAEPAEPTETAEPAPGTDPSPRRGPVRLAEVAAAAGVSLATASRVLNGSHRSVGEPHRGRVLAAAAELGYRANPHAQAIARGASNIVGLVVHDISDPYFSAIADGVMRQCEQRGLVVVMASTRRDPERELDYVATLRAQRARAVIIVGSRTRSRDLTARLAKELAGFSESGGRVACISQNRLGTHTVLVQNRAGARELARELARLGHRRLAVLTGPPELLTARDRHAGFVEGLRDSGLPDEAVRAVPGPFTRDGGYAAATELVTAGLDVTCVFAVNDVMAVGAMAAFRDHGLAIPQDVSVAGFDDIRTLRDLVPSLTTVGLPLEEMGERAAALALDTEPGERPRTVRVRGEVVLRDSTSRVR
ncbi:LacI family DNA-binding transcriptional regulator [Pseudonocardia humida]|uniref:LacI family DNA-binding transcriptional regulator n=1 Tax=Pseudonocardia humida TaxID=2800819 RepID=UPI0027E2A6CD|nr:LacI family DNA-binding transcriptional regulator [Pseudonocardia humida]